jgi:phytoene synthase
VSAECQAILARRSASFRLAARLLPRGAREDAAAVYAWCRRCDDAVDARPPAEHAGALAALRDELASIYRGDEQPDVVARAFAGVVRRHAIPPQIPFELLEGMEMDARGTAYHTLDELLVYCFRAAGTVGLMMARVLGATRPEALRHAADLGMAMQLTNVCRDVKEDWELGRVYVPAELLGGGVPRALPDRTALAPAVRRLLDEADRLYRSGDRGLALLPFRAAFAVGVARRVYAAIGTVIARRRHDVLSGRAFVPAAQKLLHVARAFFASLARLAR